MRTGRGRQTQKNKTTKMGTEPEQSGKQLALPEPGWMLSMCPGSVGSSDVNGNFHARASLRRRRRLGTFSVPDAVKRCVARQRCSALSGASPGGQPRQTLPSNRPANLGRLCQELRRGKRVKFALIWAPGSGRSTGSGRVEEAGKQSICLAYLRLTAAWPSAEPVPTGPLSASTAHGLGSPMHR